MAPCLARGWDSAVPEAGILLFVPFSPPQFELTEEVVDDHTQLIAIRGELHTSTSPEFDERLKSVIDAGKTSVVLDLSAVEFIDSTGLSVLLNGLRHVTHEGGRMLLACANPTVLRLFEITKLDSTFEIVPTRSEALERARGAQAVESDGGSSDVGTP